MQRVEIQVKYKKIEWLEDKIKVRSCNNLSLNYPIGPYINCNTVADQSNIIISWDKINRTKSTELKINIQIRN
jgi:hypothetical protein